ncbi:MAG: HRDC domain-containing protein [Myxococcota bacterium]
MTAILASNDDAARVEASIRGARRIAIDTEFHAERRYVPELYLVQVQVDGGPTWIVDPLGGDLLQRIGPALLSVPWVVHAGEQDLRVLSVALGGLPDHIDDTQLAAGLVSEAYPAAYAALVSEYLGVQVDKGETLSDWSRRPLSASQLSYAALDVQLLLQLWDALAAKLDAAGRTAIAAAACAEARRVGLEGQDDAEAFRSLPAIAALDETQLLVVQELSAWRMERARATNQPPRTILGDGVVVDLARRQPASVGALLANRRLPRSIARDADDLVERIGRARNRPPSAVPPVVRRRTAAWRAAQWVQLWAEAEGAARGFGGGLVAPRHLVEQIVLATPSRTELAGILGWRDPLIGDGLAAALGGEVSLRLSGSSVRVEGRSGFETPIGV